MEPTPMHTQRLDDRHEAALEALLRPDAPANLFPLGFLGAHGVEHAPWYGALSDGVLCAAALVLPGRLAVPCGPADACAAIGTAIRSHHAPCMVVGPRAASDALWRAWAAATPTRCTYDQRLYECRASPPGESIGGFRRAREDEWPTIARQAAQMELADLGRDPAVEDPDLHARVVRQRLRDGRTWVIERGTAIVFQVTVGTAISAGCQVGGTWVPPTWRGRGLATEGMRAVCRHLLGHHPVVTLHVNEANTAAVRCYERAGFARSAPFRLITLR